MRLLGDPIVDKRINAQNYLLEMSILEYYELVSNCLNDNEYQRKRVRNAGSIYSLLKQDLIKGCIMPPIVLAICEQIPIGSEVLSILSDKPNSIKILDGLQRSYTIKEIVLETYSDSDYLSNPIRVELYTGISRIGLLYRILTLNTGQTQMTTRHQIEIIYSDYKTSCALPNVKLISEVENQPLEKLGEYRFRDVIEGFTSYLSKDYLTLDRMDILDNVKNLERLAAESYKENIFDDYLDCYHFFVTKINSIYPNKIIEEELNLQYPIFAHSAIDMFNKSQPMTGFGNAIADLIEKGSVDSFSQIKILIDKIKESEIENGLYTICSKLDLVRQMAKKIGNEQRLFFYYFFRLLFDEIDEGFLDINQSANRAYRRM